MIHLYLTWYSFAGTKLLGKKTWLFGLCFKHSRNPSFKHSRNPRDESFVSLKLSCSIDVTVPTYSNIIITRSPW